MKIVSVIFIVLLVCQGCASNVYKSEFAFGVKLAEQGLWREAFFRWQKELARGDNSASVHNNMAVALEALGRFAEAESEYQKALQVDPGNKYIQANLNQLKKYLEQEPNENSDKK
jgi:Flp pilus assembly protein TadD